MLPCSGITSPRELSSVEEARESTSTASSTSAPQETNEMDQEMETNFEKREEHKLLKKRDEGRSGFHYDNLRPGQREVYDYVRENPKDIVVIQGYPDTGKTFTLKTIVHNLDKPFTFIIYKNDLLDDFRDIGNCYTLAGFFMDMFHLSPLKVLQDFEEKLIGRFNNAEFILTIVNLVTVADERVRRLQGSLVILDEYTVIRKPLLIVTLMLLKHFKIGTILCGNKHQLLNEQTSIMRYCTSYDIANVFADKSFELHIPREQLHSEYNKIVHFVRELASNIWLDDFARSVIVAVFHKQFFGTTKFTDTHMAGSHKVLKELADELVTKEGHARSTYMIKQRRCKDLIECSTSEDFLSYLPLVVGSYYYVDERSEKRKAELLKVNRKSVVLSLNGEKVSRKANTCDRAIYYPHKKDLLGKNVGSIFNYPIYPINFMTTLKIQGLQVSNLDITFKSMTYRGMYVAFSRVQNDSEVVHITIDDDPIGHLASCVLNFEMLVDPDFKMTEDILRRSCDYKYYKLNNRCPIKLSRIEDLLRSFFSSKSVEERRKIRDQLDSLVKALTSPKLLNAPRIGGDWTKSPIHVMLKYREYFFGLTCMEEEDRGIWLNEFLSRTPALRSLIPGNKVKHIKKNSYFYNTARLYNLPDWGNIMTKHWVTKNKSFGASRFRKEITNKYESGHDKEITSNWLVDSLNFKIREHNKRQGQKLKKLAYVKDYSDDDLDLTRASQSSKERSTEESSPSKRGSQEMVDDIEIKKKKS